VRVVTRLKWCAAALSLICACGSSVVLVGANDDAGGGQGGEADDIGAGGTFIPGTSTTTGAGGSEPMPWEHSCTMTGIDIFAGSGSFDVLDGCADDWWASQHYDGAVGYADFAGFVGSVTFRACSADGTKRLFIDLSIDGTGSHIVSYASYSDETGDYNAFSGTVDITSDGDVGEMLVGSYDVTFNPNGGGPPLHMTGGLRACHIPDLHLP
jgi:hypothetical protein